MREKEAIADINAIMGVNFDETTSEFVDDDTPPTIVQQDYCCTVVNLLPIRLTEDKPHMLPSTFFVPAAKEDRFGLLYVREGIHYIPNPLIDEGKPGSMIKQITIPAEMARSIVDDFCSAQIGLSEDAKPGLFWVDGKLNQKQIVHYHGKKLETARRQQYNWFYALCREADADWEKNKDMKAVSDLQRIAARALNVQKDWVTFRADIKKDCKYCTSKIPIGAAICPICRQVVDPARMEEIKGEFIPSSVFREVNKESTNG